MFEREELELRQERKRLSEQVLIDQSRIDAIDIRLDDIRELRYTARKEEQLIEELLK